MEIYTAKEAAVILKMHVDTLYREVKADSLPVAVRGKGR